MRYLGLLIAFVALSLLVLPGLPAQEKDKGKDKADDAKAEKKVAKDDKKAADKKAADKKDPDDPDTEKKPAKKEKVKPLEEKVEHGPVVTAKIISMKPESVRDFTIEVPMPDPQKMYDFQVWQAQQMQSIAQQAAQGRGPQAAYQHMQRMAQFQMQAAQRQSNGSLFTMKPVDVRSTEDCKVRIMYPPVQYDDNGNLKKWTQKEIAALKGKSKLPGFPADFDMLKTGSVVQVYLAKQHGSPKDKWKGPAQNQKKKKADDDPPEVVETRPEVVMIVIMSEPMGR